MNYERTVEVLVKQCDTPVRGNASQSGDAAFDKEIEDDILERLDHADVWAWAMVTVRVVVQCEKDENVYVFTGDATLGECSYEDEDDFKAGGYYEDMVKEATDALKDRLDYEIRKGDAAESLRRKLYTEAL